MAARRAIGRKRRLTVHEGHPIEGVIPPAYRTRHGALDTAAAGFTMRLDGVPAVRRFCGRAGSPGLTDGPAPAGRPASPSTNGCGVERRLGGARRAPWGVSHIAPPAAISLSAWPPPGLAVSCRPRRGVGTDRPAAAARHRSPGRSHPGDGPSTWWYPLTNGPKDLLSDCLDAARGRTGCPGDRGGRRIRRPRRGGGGAVRRRRPGPSSGQPRARRPQHRVFPARRLPHRGVRGRRLRSDRWLGDPVAH